MKRVLSFIACFIALFKCPAQIQPRNHWQFGGSVGYATSIQNKVVLYKDLVVENDTVVGVVPGNYRYGTSTGFNIDAEAFYQKKSGWYYVLGIQSFISLPSEYFTKFFDDKLYLPINQYGRSKETGGYAMMKFGIGFRTNYKRNANLFIGANLMYGGGWFRLLGYQGYADEVIFEKSWGYGQSIFLGLGINGEAGTLLRLSRNMEGVIKTGINAAGFSVWKNSDEYLKNNPTYSTGEILHSFYNINFSLGIRYKL
jgi:hypothetical protein